MRAPARAGSGASRTTCLLVLAVLTAALAACAGSPGTDAARPLVVGAIPDQDADRLQEVYGATADHLERELGVPVEYRPVTDYTAAVSQFRTGDVDLVWFGGLTGVQARLQTPGAVPVAQRDLDDDFHAVLLAGAGTGLRPVDDADVAAGLRQLRGRTLTFGSPSSTSGYLMPAHFLLEAGVDPEVDLDGPPGFSGSHDKTIDLVEAGSYDAGAVNEQVWRDRLAAGSVDAARVVELWRTPAFADYHWLLGPGAVERYGDDLPGRVREAFTGLSPADPDDARLLDLYGAGAFVPTSAAAYDEVEAVGRRLGLLGGPGSGG